MNPLDQFFAPLIGPPSRASITTKPGRLSHAEPRPYVTHEPSAGLPLCNRPEFIINRPEPWMGDSAVIECRKAMSSAQPPRCGYKSLIHLPHSPRRVNRQ